MEILGSILKIIAFLICIPAILVLLIKYLSFFANERLVTVFGSRSQIYIGGLGVIIHELSHLLLALIFHHHIDAVCLLRIPNEHDSSNRTLGYVRHSWNEFSVYQTIGNVFIGIAPVIIGMLLVYLILISFNPNLSNLHLQLTNDLLDSRVMNFESIFRILTNSFQFRWKTLPFNLISIILITSICFGGFDLSSADLKASRNALGSLTILIILATTIIYYLKLEAVFIPALVSLGVWIYLLFFVTLILLLVLNIVMFIIQFIFSH